MAFAFNPLTGNLDLVGTGGGGGGIFIDPVGMTPNAAGGSTTGSTLTLQPADGTFPGVMTAIAQTLGGDKTWNGAQKFDAAIEAHITTDAATTGANATIPLPAKTMLRLTNVGLTSVDMIAAGLEGRILVLVNKTGASLALNNETGATLANRILTGTGASVDVANNASVWVQYDTVSSRWMLIGSSPSSSITGSGTATQLTFWSGGSSITSDADFSIDTTTDTLNLGQGTDILEISTLTSNAIAAGAFTNSLLFTYPDTYTYAVIDYSIERSTNLRVGTLSIINNGVTVNVVDNYQENGSTDINLASPGVTHTLSGGNVEIRATSIGGAAGTFKKSMRRWN